MPVSDLPPSAQAMYQSWWSTVTTFASRLDPATGKPYSVTDVSAAASILRQEHPDIYPAYSPPGVSALYSQALQIARASQALAAASPAGPIPDTAVARPPWSRPDAEIATMPVWQARAEITYLDPAGTEITGITTVTIPQVLPSSVASLQAQMELRITDQLSSPPGTGTPRSGTLVSVGAITLLAVLAMQSRDKYLDRQARYNNSPKGRARRDRYEQAHPERRERWSVIMLIKARDKR